MGISIWRADTLAKYEKKKEPNDCIENALLCEEYGESLFLSSCDDAVFWFKKSLEIREALYGKNSIENVTQYERIAYFYAMKPSEKNALNWYRKALRIRESEVGKSDLSLVEDYLCLAEIYRNLNDFESCKENTMRAMEIEKEHRPADNPVSFRVYKQLEAYHSFRCYANYQEGEPSPLRSQEDTEQMQQALLNMMDSAVKEYGADSCEAVACIEKYIHDIKIPVYERLKIAGNLLKIYYAHEEAFLAHKKRNNPYSDFINLTSGRITADIWYSWMNGGWFPWDGSGQWDETRDGIGWGIKWIKKNVSDEIAEKVILRFSLSDQEMIRQIMAQEPGKPPVR